MPGTATISGTTIKQVQCQCGAQYAYRMERTATATALGTIRSLEAIVQGLEEKGEKLEEEGANFRKRASELEARIGHPFEHEEHFQELRKRQSAIADQLDLTKNQAATQLDAEPGPEQMNTFSEKETPMEATKPVRKTAMRV